MKIALYLPRQLRWPLTWGTAFGSLGLALLAGPATTNSTAGPPGQTQAVALDLTSAPETSLDAADDEADDVDEDDEPSGKVRIGGAEPEADELPAGSMRIQGGRPARPSISLWTRKAKIPKASVARRAPRSKCRPPLDQRPESMTVAALPSPADVQNEGVSDDSIEQASIRPTSQPPSERQFSPAPSSAEDDPEDRDDPVENDAPPAMSLEQEEGAAAEIAEDAADEAADEAEIASAAEDPAFISLTDEPPLVSQSSAGDCPTTPDNVDFLVNRIHDDDTYGLQNRKPIGKLRADRRMRLPNRHSILWNLREKADDENEESQRAATRKRVVIHEEVRCFVESERQAIRADYRAAYGPYFDRSTGGGSDENVSPLFPYTYYPLYFEDPNLERCGYSLGCVQPFVSMAHFYGNVALFPFKAIVLCPWDCVYPQADCEPCTRYSCRDNILGPCPETTGWGCFKSRRYSCRTCKGQSW